MLCRCYDYLITIFLTLKMIYAKIRRINLEYYIIEEMNI